MCIYIGLLLFEVTVMDGSSTVLLYTTVVADTFDISVVVIPTVINREVLSSITIHV